MSAKPDLSGYKVTVAYRERKRLAWPAGWDWHIEIPGGGRVCKPPQDQYPTREAAEAAALRFIDAYEAATRKTDATIDGNELRRRVEQRYANEAWKNHCGICLAKPGEPCVRPNGFSIDTVHAARRDGWQPDREPEWTQSLVRNLRMFLTDVDVTAPEDLPRRVRQLRDTLAEYDITVWPR